MKTITSLIAALILSASLALAQVIATPNTHKFLPPEGKQLLIIGQDNASVGGFQAPNNNGYYENVQSKIGGVTTYTNLPGLDGLYSFANWGAGPLNAQAIVDNPNYKNSVVSIGLYLVDQLELINKGRQDDQIARLGRWIQDAQRPVFLRIGYEFDGVWNHYDPEEYKMAFRRFCHIFDSLGVENCATVWQSGTSPVDDALEGKHENIADWYPGDEYVDYMAYSWFLSDHPDQFKLTDELVNFARERGKPVMCAESAAQGYDIAKGTRRDFASMLDGEAGGNKRKKKPEEIWEEWFKPYFDYIEKNKDVIKVVAYINANWDEQPLWGAPWKEGYWGDTRVEANDYVLEQWLKTVNQENWLHSSDQLFELLGYPVNGQ